MPVIDYLEYVAGLQGIPKEEYHEPCGGNDPGDRTESGKA